MARLQIRALIQDGASYDDYFGTNFILAEHSGSEIHLVQFPGNNVYLRGTGFSYGPNDEILGGVIKAFEVTDTAGGTFAILNGAAKVNIADLGGLGNFNLEAIARLALRGDDRISGSGEQDLIFAYGGDDIIFARNGDDRILGAEGRDRMTGGGGSDTFLVGLSQGKDVITDFDVRGSDGSQDFLGLEFAEVYTIKQKGRDTLIEFGDDSSVRLLDVRAGLVGSEDFVDFAY